MQEEFTINCVRFKSHLAGPQGAAFIVYKDNHTEEEVKEAIKELRNSRDVVHIRQATPGDLVDDFWTKVFKYAEDMYFLNWQQIDKDIPELYNAVRTGKTPEQYVDSKWKIWKSGTFKISE